MAQKHIAISEEMENNLQDGAASQSSEWPISRHANYSWTVHTQHFGCFHKMSMFFTGLRTFLHEPDMLSHRKPVHIRFHRKCCPEKTQFAKIEKVQNCQRRQSPPPAMAKKLMAK
jgi:hypothetical protein